MHLTDKEIEILNLADQDLSRKEFCHILGVSENTAISRRTYLRNKLGVKGDAGLYKAALEYGILPMPTRKEYIHSKREE